MADLSLPSDVEITDLPIAPWYPGLIASQGEFTGATTYHATARRRGVVRLSLG